MGYSDYLEQLTYLLSLKMADEYTRAPYNRTMPIPAAHNWQSLTPLRGAELEVHYQHNIFYRVTDGVSYVIVRLFTEKMFLLQ